MKVRFEAKFAKDLRNINDGKLLAKLVGAEQSEAHQS